MEMVLLDLQKPFDMVNTDILCKRLEVMGIYFTDQFKSYLEDEKQTNIAKGISTKTKTVKCGVLQGSILSAFYLCIMLMICQSD